MIGRIGFIPAVLKSLIALDRGRVRQMCPTPRRPKTINAGQFIPMWRQRRQLCPSRRSLPRYCSNAGQFR
jgi:hypothetical protein